MGNSESQDTLKESITTSINNEINNLTNNITRIMTKTVNDTTMTMINKSATMMSATTGGTNTVTGDEYTATGAGSVIDLNQSLNVEAVVKASIDLISDNTAMAKLGTQLANDLKSSTVNDNALSSAMQAVNAIIDAQERAGGPEALVSDVMKSITDMGTQFSNQGDSEKETSISNIIKSKISNTTINQNDINNVVENKINQGIENIKNQTCELKTNADNLINVARMTAAQGGTISINQSAEVKAALDCVLKAIDLNGITTEILNTMQTSAANEAENKNKADSSLSADTQKVTEKKEGSAIMDTIDNLVNKTAGQSLYLVLGCCICLVFVLIFLYFLMKNPGTIKELKSVIKD